MTWYNGSVPMMYVSTASMMTILVTSDSIFAGTLDCSYSSKINTHAPKRFNANPTLTCSTARSVRSLISFAPAEFGCVWSYRRCSRTMRTRFSSATSEAKFASISACLTAIRVPVGKGGNLPLPKRMAHLVNLAAIMASWI